MKVSPEQLLDEGFIILREVVPPAQLDELRASVETLVDRQKAISARDRKPDEPPGGAWEVSAQPRVNIDAVVDEATANTVEFCLHENTLGVSRQLMQCEETTLTNMQVLCSGVHDYGATDWHRDIDCMEQAPLCGLQMDLVENMPGYVQWNIALYDDDVLWVVPGSHRRPDDDAQNRQLLIDPCVPLPGGVQVKLKAGDGVVYPNIIMHWGSNYTTKLRRTIHLGYRAFGTDIFPYVHHFHWARNLNFTKCLSPKVRAKFERFVELHTQERDQIEAVFRAILSKDVAPFRTGLATLHPGERGRMVCVMLLARLANKIYKLKNPEIAALPQTERARVVAGTADYQFYEDFGHRFSFEEADTLRQRLSKLSDRLEGGAARCHEHYAKLFAELKPNAEASVPNFHSRSLRTLYTDMPADFDVDDFIASWRP